MSGETRGSLIERLSEPGREYSPIPFWFLNGDLTHREIRRQLRDFRDHGVFGVVLHPRMGLSRRIGYLSPLFFRYLRTAIETAAALDMRVVLYDEGMYPSGSACGQVVKDRPDLASRGIALTDAPRPGDTLLCETPWGLLVERFSGGTIRGVHYGEDDGEAKAPASADILNPEAVARFIALTHEAYYREFSRYFGNTIIGFFTDEPSILGRNVRDMMPWTAGFAELFTAAGGDLRGLAGLFTGEENADTALYRSLILQREGAVYYKSLSDWCAAHGIALMGHPHQSDDIEVQRYFHIPGQDLVYRWVSPEGGGLKGTDSVMGKCSADMARHMGRPRNSNECFGACGRAGNPWLLTGADMKWFIDWLAVRGVNLFIPHAFYYSLRGKRSAERPPDVGPGSIWWPHYRLWAGYMARLSRLMAESDLQAEVALACRNREMRPEAAAPLFASQRGFEYLPESLWPDCREEKSALVCGRRRYRAVVGPEALFPGISHDPETVPPDVLCRPPMPDLRVAKLKDGERTLWLLVNEGEGPIETGLTLPTAMPLGWYDLWNDRKRRVESAETPEGRAFPLRLAYRESALIFTCNQEEWGQLPEEPHGNETLTEADFTLESQEKGSAVKVYTAWAPQGEDDLTVLVKADEMAELYAGDRFCGAAFWAPQIFTVPAGIRREGAVRLRLIVTGSRANRYGKPVPYGLEGST